MTIRSTAQRRRGHPHGTRVALPWVLAIAVIAGQIAYPLLDGEPLRLLTHGIVVAFFLASVSHAWVHRGAAWAAGMVAVTAGGGLLAEAVGVRTGVPFGDYAYTGSLAPEVFGVPAIVPLAWTMMGYPAFVAARALTRRWVPLVGGVALTGWDVFLDPQMVAAGHWRWAYPEPGLPGVEGIPLTNFAGWLLVSVLMMAVLDRLPRRRDVGDAQPALLFFWTWIGSVVGNLFFFDRPGVALAGGLAMGVVAVPYAVVLWRERP